jgi:hypothetical protein
MRGDIVLTLAGIATLGATFTLLWLLVPARPATNPSPYLTVAASFGFLLAFAMLMMGLGGFFRFG